MIRTLTVMTRVILFLTKKEMDRINDELSNTLKSLGIIEKATGKTEPSDNPLRRHATRLQLEKCELRVYQEQIEEILHSQCGGGERKKEDYLVYKYDGGAI